MPTESSVADQIVRFTPSQVGSFVLRRAESSMVLKMEQTVALGGGVSLDDRRGGGSGRGVSEDEGAGRIGDRGKLTPSRGGRRCGDPIVCGGGAGSRGGR
jgi:hypothetical protein